MKRNFILTGILTVAVCLPASATIINVPDDYETIQEGIDASTDGDTVLVQPGTYVENVNFNGHNIVLGSLFLTTGDMTYIAETIIDGDSSGSVVTIESGEDNSAIIMGFTIQSGYSSFGGGGGIDCSHSAPTIINNIVSGNYGGGIFCWNSDATVKNNLIRGNSALYTGGGISCVFPCTPTIENNTISGNSAGYNGGGIYCQECEPVIIKNAITGNSTSEGGGISCMRSDAIIHSNTVTENSAAGTGGGIAIKGYCHPIITNCTISENTADIMGGGIAIIDTSYPAITNTIFCADNAPIGPEIFVDDISWAVFTYCDIQGNWEGEGNIQANPKFRDGKHGDFRLASEECGNHRNSPCIDAGHPDILDSLLSCDWGLGELRSDMGAYGGGDSVTVGIDNEVPETPDRFAVAQNYPNPFNISTIIHYQIPATSDVRIDIYDILGRKVAILVDEKQPAGYHQTIWNADGRSSGVYFYRIQAGDFIETKRMMLLK